MISFASQCMKFHPVIPVLKPVTYICQSMWMLDFHHPFHLTLQVKNPWEAYTFSLWGTTVSTFWVKKGESFTCLTVSSLWIFFAALHSHQCVTISSKTWLWTYHISNTNFAETIDTAPKSLPLHYPVHQKTRRPQNLRDTTVLNLTWRGRRKRAKSRSGKHKRRSR